MAKNLMANIKDGYFDFNSATKDSEPVKFLPFISEDELTSSKFKATDKSPVSELLKKLD